MTIFPSHCQIFSNRIEIIYDLQDFDRYFFMFFDNNSQPSELFEKITLIISVSLDNTAKYNRILRKKVLLSTK